MAKKTDDKMVEFKVSISADQDKLFKEFKEKNKFASDRLAFAHLLAVADSMEVSVDLGEKAKAPHENGENGKVDAKEKETKKGNGRKGKKAGEIVASSDGEHKHSGEEMELGNVGSDGDKERAQKVVSPKKANGRQAKKAAKDTAHGDHDGEDGNNMEMSDDEEQKPEPKRSPVKKTTAAKGKQGAGNKHDVSPDTQEADAKPEPAKKAARGKKASTPAPEIEHADDEDVGKKGQKAKKDNATDGAPDAKKRRGGKQAKGDDADADHQEVGATTTKGRRGTKKSASTVADALHEGDGEDHEDGAAATGDGKKGGKRKPAASKAVHDEEAGPSTAAKTARGRAAKQNKNYAQPASESD